MAWEKWTFENKRGRQSPFSKLKIGECYFTPKEFYPSVYNALNYQIEKYDKNFETLKCINGTVIKRTR